MRKLFFILALLSLLVFATPGSVYAQHKVRADIPFTFTVTDKPLVAGSYTVALYAIEVPALLIQESEHREAQAYALTNFVDTNQREEVKPKLVFRRYGEQYFLAEVWMGAGNTVGREIPKSAKERLVSKNGFEPTLIYVAAK